MSMLITVYERRHQGWEPVRRYYRFGLSRLEIEPAESTTRPGRILEPRYVCPGCDQRFTEAVMTTHMCVGGTEQYPRVARRNTGLGRPRKAILGR